MYRQLLARNSLEGESKYGGWTNQNRGSKSRTDQNWKQVHVAVDPPFTDCTQYLPKPLVAIPISLILMQTVPACRSQTGGGQHVISSWWAARTYVRNLKIADYRALWCTQRSITLEQSLFSKNRLNLSPSVHRLDSSHLDISAFSLLWSQNRCTGQNDRMTEWLTNRLL